MPGMNNVAATDLTGRIQLHAFGSRDELAAQLAQRVAALLAAAVEHQGSAVMAVSGGSTPAPFFAELSLMELPWTNVTLLPVDERWLAPEHEDSNERLIRGKLLTNRASSARFISLKSDAPSAFLGVQEIESRLAGLPNIDLVVLGMGLDGHTASLFPDAEGLDRALALDNPASCCAIKPPRASYERISLTLRRIVSARYPLLYITGRDKRDLLMREAGERHSHLPVRALLEALSGPLNVFWAP